MRRSIAASTATRHGRRRRRLQAAGLVVPISRTG
jgi:hypothetical protein